MESAASLHPTQSANYTCAVFLTRTEPDIHTRQLTQQISLHGINEVSMITIGDYKRPPQKSKFLNELNW
jgi:hypothetical protein